MKKKIYIGVVNDEILGKFLDLYPPHTEIHMHLVNSKKPYEYEMQEEYAIPYLKFKEQYK